VHGRYGRLGYGMAVLFVFGTALYSGALGALITLAPRLWYPIYGSRTAALDIDPMTDQQLAGLIMWIPAGTILIIVALALFAAWLGAMERRTPA
ncbi:MAG TPA: cytochrome c oxidase assembly protein, partial [Thermoanaerobaculia bacterium]|nr:cytochrome c oxidase assembly protein [Thermoanaerobaculia bacterium]